MEQSHRNLHYLRAQVASPRARKPSPSTRANCAAHFAAAGLTRSHASGMPERLLEKMRSRVLCRHRACRRTSGLRICGRASSFRPETVEAPTRTENGVPTVLPLSDNVTVLSKVSVPSRPEASLSSPGAENSSVRTAPIVMPKSPATSPGNILSAAKAVRPQKLSAPDPGDAGNRGRT